MSRFWVAKESQQFFAVYFVVVVNVQEPGTDLLAESLDELAICGEGGQVGLKGAIFFWNLPKNDRPEEQLVEIAGFPSGILKSWTANKSYADIGLKVGGGGGQ